MEEGKIAVKVPSSKSRKVKLLPFKEKLAQYGERNLLLWLHLEVGGRIVSRNLATFTRPKHLLLEDPDLSARMEEVGDNAFELSLAAARPSLWVWPDIPGSQVTYSDRFFHLMAGESRKISISPWKETTLQQLEKKVKAYSLIDTYR